MGTSLVGSPQLLTSLTPRVCLEPLLFALRWLNLMPRSLPSSQVRELGIRKARRKHKRPKRRKSQRTRKRRKKNLPVMKYPWNQRRKIPWMLYPRVLLILRNGRGFIPTMTRTLPSPGSGSILTMKITPSGEAITSTMTSSPWSSCLAISSEGCSSAWRNSRRTLLHPVVCLARTMIPLLVVSGSSRGSYDWKKLDSKSAECKAQVAQYWKWEGKDAQDRFQPGQDPQVIAHPYHLI